MAQRMWEHQVLVDFYTRNFISKLSDSTLYNTGTLQTGLTIYSIPFPNGQQTFWKMFERMEE
jgi:hypothetical protein